MVGWFQKLVDGISFWLVLILFGVFFAYILVRRAFYKGSIITTNPATKKMMCFVPITMESLKQKGVEQHILQRDLGGYWEKVYTVHPSCDKEEVLCLNNTHTVLEFCSHCSNFLHKIGMRRTNGLYSVAILLRKTYEIIHKEQISVLKAHDPYIQGIIGLILSTLCKVPYVIMVCSSYDLVYETTGRIAYPFLKFRRIEKILARITFKNAAMAFGGSQDASEFAINNGARREKTFTVRTGGVNEEHFQPLQSRRDLKEELGLKDKKTIIYVGRLSAEKFPEDVIMSFVEVNKIMTDSLLLMVGDGSLRESLEALARGLGVDNSARFLGFQPQEMVMNLMFTADVIVSPLTGSALVEACLSSTPVVAYDVDWHPELIKDEETGLLVPYRDYKAMAQAVMKMLRNDELAKRLGRNARKLALAQHHLDVVTREERRCFEKLFSGELS